MSFEPILSPSLRIASGLGPMNVTPIRSHSSAKAGSSATKPQPTHTASALGLAQGPLEHRVVEVRARRGRAQGVGDVGLADEHRGALGVGVQRDDLDRCRSRILAVRFSALRSRTAWIRRMAASPRFTIAIRENKAAAPEVTFDPDQRYRACPVEAVTSESLGFPKLVTSATRSVTSQPCRAARRGPSRILMPTGTPGSTSASRSTAVNRCSALRRRDQARMVGRPRSTRWRS